MSEESGERSRSSARNSLKIVPYVKRHKRRYCIAACALVLAAAVNHTICLGQKSGQIPAGYGFSELLGRDTYYETPVHIFQGMTEGPVVMAEAGIHGDEVAGILALDGLLPRLYILSGKLIVLPRMNRPACVKKVRFLNQDLNLVFPGRKDARPYEQALAREIYDYVGRHKVQYLVTLHEALSKYNEKTGHGLGQTVVYGVKPAPAYLDNWLSTLNTRAMSPSEIFHAVYYPVKGSSTETMAKAYNLSGGFCVETWRGFSLEERIRMQTEVILSFLETVGLRYRLER